jgi:hypothetical protein
VIALVQESGDDLVFLFVADTSFLAQLAAPIVVDVERRLEDMGRFELARACLRAEAEGVKAQAVVRRGRFREELASAASELGASLIALGSPTGPASVFEHETLLAFASALQDETGIEVCVL